jgi:hypothetical protein
MNDINQSIPQLSPQEITERGEKIYNEQLKVRLEQESLGKYVVIDILSGKHFIAETADAAIALGKQDVPNGIFHLIKIGSSSAFSLGSMSIYQI